MQLMLRINVADCCCCCCCMCSMLKTWFWTWVCFVLQQNLNYCHNHTVCNKCMCIGLCMRVVYEYVGLCCVMLDVIICLYYRFFLFLFICQCCQTFFFIFLLLLLLLLLFLYAVVTLFMMIVAVAVFSAPMNTNAYDEAAVKEKNRRWTTLKYLFYGKRINSWMPLCLLPRWFHLSFEYFVYFE